MQKKQIDWAEVQKLYDSGKTIAECGAVFGFGRTTAYKEKMRVVMETHSDKKFVIIEKDRYERIMQGELVWS